MNVGDEVKVTHISDPEHWEVEERNGNLRPEEDPRPHVGKVGRVTGESEGLLLVEFPDGTANGFFPDELVTLPIVDAS